MLCAALGDEEILVGDGEKEKVTAEHNLNENFSYLNLFGKNL